MNTRTESKTTTDEALSLRNVSLMRAHLAVGVALEEIWKVKNTAKMAIDSGDGWSEETEKIHALTVGDLSIVERRLEKIHMELDEEIRDNYETQKARRGK